MKAMKKLLIVTIIIALVETLRTGYIDGLCLLPIGPLIVMLDEWDPQRWAQKKLEERTDD